LLLGTTLLAHGALQDGWSEYGRRPPALRFREKYPQLALTRTLPQDLAGKQIAVLREQGLGDEIFFLRYAPLLHSRGARIVYRASNKIATLLARLPMISQVVEEMSPLPPCEANILVGDLPHALGELASSSLPTPPAAAEAGMRAFDRRISLYWPPVPPSLVLEPLAQRVEELRARLAAAGPPPYIGVTWRAGTAPEEQSSVAWLLYKKIDLVPLGHTLRGVRATILALQRKPASGEIDALANASGHTVHDFTAFNEDLEGMLALLALIDDYVGVSNTNMHLRAAAGRTGRVLVPMPAEWRWMQWGRSSPWFPGFSIYRQSLQGKWDPAFDDLRRDLAANYGAARASNTA
jgi:hypothetical protein